MAEDPRQWVWDQIGPPPPQPRTQNPLHDDDPSNDWQFDDWKAMADRWRAWARAEEDLVVRGMEQGQSLEDMGYENAKDQGKSMHSRFGKGGLFSEYGANVDPGWEYDWASGKKRHFGTDDKAAQQKWVPISREEYEGYRVAQQAKGQGAETYGQQAGMAAMGKNVQQGHFTFDPRTGLYYNFVGNDPNQLEVKDKFNRALYGGPTNSWASQMGIGKPPSSSGGWFNMAGMGAQPQQQAQGFNMGGNTGFTGGLNPNNRPYLKTDPTNSNYGAWGSTFGKPQKKGAAQAETMMGTSNQYQSPSIPGLNQQRSY